jgi:hypothetical protein
MPLSQFLNMLVMLCGRYKVEATLWHSSNGFWARPAMPRGSTSASSDESRRRTGGRVPAEARDDRSGRVATRREPDCEGREASVLLDSLAICCDGGPHDAAHLPHTGSPFSTLR